MPEDQHTPASGDAETVVPSSPRSGPGDLDAETVVPSDGDDRYGATIAPGAAAGPSGAAARIAEAARAVPVRETSTVDTPPGGADTPAPPSSESPFAAVAAPASPPMPERIGHYRPTRVIGAGGMGTVYEAEQESPRRTVAVKVMKPGIVTPSTLRRFEYESQLLARLRHPGIAQVYEAGVHDDGSGGVPYFAMEFIVDARTLTEHASAKALAPRQRLELFAKVCDAVHHGHQKGIIHRDLKPDNILVDALGQPKIIDFGVARATESDIAVTTVQTEVGQLIGTVQYMSPEQIEADPDDIDTRSDVYALGVVLYVLLTGKLPYEIRNVPIYEATRIIRDQPPKRIAQLDRTLKGDVETIVLHALEKDRDRRYQSALALKQDIERYLSNHSILARPPSLPYQIRTFAKRNKPLVGGIAAVFAALVLGIVGMTMEAKRARRAEAEAMATLGGVERIFGSIDPRDGAGAEVKVIDMLRDFAPTIEQDFGAHPRVEASLRAIVGNAYRSLTDWRDAETQLRKAVEIQERELGDPHADLAQSLLDLGAVLWFRNELAEAETCFARSLDMRRRLHKGDHEDVASSLNYLAACYDAQGKRAEARELYESALEMRVRVHGPDAELVARSMNNLATCLMRSGPDHHERAERLYRQAVATWRRVHGESHMDIANGLSNLARLHKRRGEDAEAGSAEQSRAYALAAEERRLSLEIKQRELGEGNTRIATTMYHSADVLLRQARLAASGAAREELLAEAETMARGALRIREAKFDEDHVTWRTTRDLLANILLERGRLDDAERVARELVALHVEHLSPTDGQTVAAKQLLARVLDAAGASAEAADIRAELASLE